jgi:alpha-mannosidase
MRKFLLPLLFLSHQALAGSGRPDVYVTRVFKLKAEVTYDQGKAAAEALNPILKKTKGFEKRNLFFDKESKTFIDQIKWKHAEVAQAGMKNIEKETAFGKLNALIDDKSVQKFSGERIFELESTGE